MSFMRSNGTSNSSATICRSPVELPVPSDRDPGIDLILGRAIGAKFDSASAYPSSACGTPYTSECKSDDQHTSAFKHITAAESFCIICVHLGLLRPRMLV